jgi:Raf kinase inhibitor-like YbhB/YbcL family protein
MPEVVARRALLASMTIGVAGCIGAGSDGGTPTDADNPAIGDAAQIGQLELSSPAFEDGGSIPREDGREQRNVNPPLEIAGVPDGSGSLVLIMDDPDAVDPAGEVWLHWLVWNIDPGRREIPEARDGGQAVGGVNDFDERGYGGPAPPDREHTYRFKGYAIDRTFDLPVSASKATVGDAMAGGILSQTHLEATFAP